MPRRRKQSPAPPFDPPPIGPPTANPVKLFFEATAADVQREEFKKAVRDFAFRQALTPKAAADLVDMTADQVDWMVALVGGHYGQARIRLKEVTEELQGLRRLLAVVAVRVALEPMARQWLGLTDQQWSDLEVATLGEVEEVRREQSETLRDGGGDAL